MSQIAINLLGIVAILAIGGYYWHRSSTGGVSAVDDSQPALGSTSEDAALPSGSDDSDAAMQVDLKAVDAQMSGFDADSSSINGGIDAQASGDAQ